MNVLLRQVVVVDPSSPFHNRPTDIFIENGIISSINEQLHVAADREVALNGLHVSPGWVDIFAHFWDPGFEYKETLESGALAAVAGGYTDALVLPNTAPPLHNKAAVEYIVQKSKTLPVNVHPIGAVTKNTEGKELAEMYDMQNSGAVAFSDGTSCIQSSGLLLKALQYLKSIGKILIQLPDDAAIHPGGLMNEGIASTRLGLPGRPAIAEELIVARDIELVRYTDSKIHFTGISTAKAVERIRGAKKEGLAVTCSVTPYHLTFCDEDLADYDTDLKVNPPLRTRADRERLREAVLDGAVDCIATHHLPQDRDSKMLEFEHAKFGMLGLQTGFAAVRTVLPQLSLQRITELFSLQPRMIFGLENAAIKEGAAARFTLFFPDEEWVFTPDKILSRSKNSAYAGKTLKGKPIGIINKEGLFLNAH